jgi:hypothetical protein
MNLEAIAQAGGPVALAVAAYIFHCTGVKPLGNTLLAVALMQAWFLGVLPADTVPQSDAVAATFVAGNESDWYHVPGAACVPKQKRPLVPLADEAEARASGRSPCPVCVQNSSVLASMPSTTNTTTKPMPARR